MSILAVARRHLRGRKTIWTVNSVLLLICLVLFITDRSRDDPVFSLDHGPRRSRDIRDQAKPSQPHKAYGGFVDRVAQGRGGTSPTRRNELKRKAQVPYNKKQVDFCSTAQYANGTWQARKSPPGSISDIRQLNSLGESGSMGCHPINWPIEEKGEPSLDEPAHIERLIQAASWRWVPADGCERRDFSKSAFVQRLLRSKGGLFLVGDSLTEHHMVILTNLLVQPGSPWVITGWGERPRFQGLSLDPNHPETKDMLQAAGVSAKRCETPIISFYLERHLITREEMDQVMKDVETGYTPFSSGEGLEKWVADAVWYDEYVKVMRGPDIELDPEIAIEENTVLVLNSGPHWVNYEFTKRPDYDSFTYYDEILHGWDNTIELLLSKIAKVPAAKQSVFWRATAPGHPHCELSNMAENRTDFRSTTDPNFMRYNWDLFEKLNQRWKRRLGAAPGGPGKDVVTGMQYLDIWPMSVQRPDAHLLPPNDCLHYCYGVGGVMEEWQKFLWHVVASQSRNTDYNFGRPAYL